MRVRSRVAAGVAATVVAASVAAVALAPSAVASGEGVGLWVNGQSWAGRRSAQDWEGTYRLGDGSLVWCVQYGYATPDKAGGWSGTVPLTNKWGGALTPGERAAAVWLAAGRAHAGDADWAAAVSILLHELTGKQRPVSGSWRDTGYDGPAHYNAAPKAVQQIIDRLRADGGTKAGPWTVAVTPQAPASAAVAGAAGEDRSDGPSAKAAADTPPTLREGVSAAWRVVVRSASGAPVPDTDVDLTAAGGTAPAHAHTGPDGTALVPVTPASDPAAARVRLDASVASPAAEVLMRVPDNDHAQRVVVLDSATTARAAAEAPVVHQGTVALTKIVAGDPARTPVPGAVLHVTTADGTVLADKITTTDQPVKVPAWPGDVHVTELATPEGLEASGETVTVHVEPGKVAEVAFADTVHTTVIKTDHDDHAHHLSGAHVRISTDEAGTAVVGPELTTGEDGTVVVPGGLAAGHYWLAETTAPAGYQRAEHAQEFTVAPAVEKAGAKVELFDARIVLRTEAPVPVTAVTAGPVVPAQR